MSINLYRNFINGEYYSNQSGEVLNVINPATGEVIYQVEIADEYIRKKAVISAEQGFILWSSMSNMERGRILNKAAFLIRQRNDDLAMIEVCDTGKPWQEASTVDILSGADAIEFFAGLASSILGNQQSVGKDFYYTRREPLGICAGIGAWNYPFQIACWKSAPALAAGNCMIFKPSEETPLGALKLAEIFIEAGVPKGVFNVIIGKERTGIWLSKEPKIDKLSFTGQVQTGKIVMQNSSSSLKKLTMELGGKSPLIIFDDTDLQDAVSGAMLGNFYTQGEVCTHCTRVFVHRKIYNSFTEALLERIEKNIIIGDPQDIKTNFGALISKKHYEKVLEYIKIGKSEGAKLLCGGYPVRPYGFTNGFFIGPTVFTECTDNMTIVKEEIFGPVMSILVFDDEDEVVSRANNTDFGLGSGIFTSNITRAHRIAHKLQSGICWINSYGSSPVEMPVGGYKQSGIGRENGIETLHEYTQVKSIYVGLEKIKSPY
jgi:betaine-aldehyde dehydrogenase